MSPHLETLAWIATLYIAAVVVPGPNLLVISTRSIAAGRGAGARVALGISVGSTLWAILAMAGLAALMAAHAWMGQVLRVLGAVYLIWFGIRLLRSAAVAAPARAAAAGSRAAGFGTGLLTSLTNPKSGAFWAGVFATVFPADAPGWLFAATTVLIACLSAAWHLGVAVAFTLPRLRDAWMRRRRAIEGVCGTMLIGLGLRLVWRG